MHFSTACNDGVAMRTTIDFYTMIRFTYETGARAERRYPFQTSWRKLPGGLIERPEGGNWILELEGRAPITVHSGEVLVVPQGINHCLTMAGAKIMQTEWMTASFDSLPGMDILSTCKVPPILPRPAGNKLSGLMAGLRKLKPAIAQGDVVSLAHCQTIGFQILAVLLDYAEVRHLAPIDPDINRLLPLLYYVENNLDKPISINELARQASLSSSRFHCVFKQLLGVSPKRYIQNARLRFAQRLLMTGSRQIKEVAALAGFPSPFYFSRVFRRHFKTTPTGFSRDPHWSSSLSDKTGNLKKMAAERPTSQ